MRRHPAAVNPVDVDGLVTAVVGIDRRLSLFRRHLERFARDTASRPDGAGPGPAARARHPQPRGPAMPP